MPRAHKWVNPVFEMQADATLAQVNPISGTQYEVLATTRNVRIIDMAANCVWTVQPTPLEIHVTIDGITYTFFVVNPASGTYYHAKRQGESAENAQGLRALNYGELMAFIFEGRSVRVTAEITGGTVQNLNARVRYATIPDA